MLFKRITYRSGERLGRHGTFGQIFRGTGLHRIHGKGFATLSREHNDRWFRTNATLAESLQKLKATHVGQIEIQQNTIEHSGLQRLETLDGGCCLEKLVLAPGIIREQMLIQRTITGIVIHEQHFDYRARGHHFLQSGGSVGGEDLSRLPSDCLTKRTAQPICSAPK